MAINNNMVSALGNMFKLEPFTVFMIQHVMRVWRNYKYPLLIGGAAMYTLGSTSNIVKIKRCLVKQYGARNPYVQFIVRSLEKMAKQKRKSSEYKVLRRMVANVYTAKAELENHYGPILSCVDLFEKEILSLLK
jgi:hypothetical protein